MNERDPAPAGPEARDLVDEPVAGAPAGVEGPVEVGHPVADVVDTRAAPLEKAGDRSRRLPRGEQLDVALSHREGDDGGAVGKFVRPRDQAEDVSIERERGLEVRYGDAHVRDARLVGHGNEGNRSRERT